MGDNLLQILFLFLASTIFCVGVGTNYFEQYLPAVLVQAYRYGRPNIFRTRLTIVKKLEISKRLFLHFFIFAVFWQSVVLIQIIRFRFHYYHQTKLPIWLEDLLDYLAPAKSCASKANPQISIIASTLFLLHCFRRLLECLFLDKHSNQAKMTLLHYTAAMYHYFGGSLCFIAHLRVFRSENLNLKPEDSGFLEISFLQIIAVFIFLIASWEQFQSHRILAEIRSSKGAQELYMIPHGRLYELISCPNYFCEILIYASIGLIFKFQNTSWNTLLLWVLSNQTMDAIMSHKWYQATFQNYPKSRKALIPFIL